MPTHARMASCNGMMRRHWPLFLCPTVIGMTFFVLIQGGSNLFYELDYALSPSMLHDLGIFDRITLPRSNFEFDVIRNYLGTTYYCSTVVCWALISASSLVTFTFLMRKAAVEIKGDAQTSSTSRVFATLLLFVIELIWHPAVFDSSGLTTNHPDATGLYFFKEGLNMSLGYGCLYFFILNVWASSRSR